MKVSVSFRRRRNPQQGYVLMAILLMLAVLLVALAAAAPRTAQEIRRQQEQELIDRGLDYARAVKRFYRKFGRYPTRVEELENTNNIRFLRRRWKDPFTGEELRIIRYGQQKTQPRGLFGAPAGATGAGGGIAGAVLGSTLGTPAGGQQPQPGSPGTPAENLAQPLPGGQTFGGGAIIGVGGAKDQASIKEWNGKSNYKDWEFIYDPRFDPGQPQQGGAGNIPVPGGPQVPSPLRPPGQPQPPPPNTPR